MMVCLPTSYTLNRAAQATCDIYGLGPFWPLQVGMCLFGCLGSRVYHIYIYMYIYNICTYVYVYIYIYVKPEGPTPQAASVLKVSKGTVFSVKKMRVFENLEPRNC